MLKKFFLSSLVFLGLFVLIFPTKRENTKLFDFCYSLEKIITKNSIEKRDNLSKNVTSISKDLIKYSVSKTRGRLINKIIDKYKNSRDIFVITVIPNQFYCFAGYWLEEIKPGTFEDLFYENSKQKINEFNDIKNEVDKFMKDMNTEYLNIKKEFNKFF
tara:strand:- start:4364 stop:4840 length:477 start_codon:yes stop_codon:yes gene_type:complete